MIRRFQKQSSQGEGEGGQMQEDEQGMEKQAGASLIAN